MEAQERSRWLIHSESKTGCDVTRGLGPLYILYSFNYGLTDHFSCKLKAFGT